MLTGSIQSVISKDEGLSSRLADKLGKRHESDWVTIYYRKSNEKIRSVLLPRGDRILEEAQALSLSDVVYVAIDEPLKPEDGEIALLAEASGSICQVIGPALLHRYLGELEISKNIVADMLPVEGSGLESGFTYVDRIFKVKGVGTVALGFSGEPLSVHDKLYAFPSGKIVEVKSIQVLDEDQDSVGVGVRVGLALKGAELEDIKDTYALSRNPSALVVGKILAKVIKFKWAGELPTKVHAVSYGVKVMVGVEDGILVSDIPFPSAGRAILVDVNARPRTPRVVGYAVMSEAEP
ncbi:MAG: translation elongation factor [Thermoprotei archaeon]